MAAEQIRSLYASMPDRLARARRKFGRGLTLAEKIFVAHCDDFPIRLPDILNFDCKCCHCGRTRILSSITTLRHGH